MKRSRMVVITLILAVLMGVLGACSPAETYPLARKEIRIRDPFILVDDGKYYMYGTTDLEDGSLRARNTFSVYVSADLENFSEPKTVVDGDALDFWGTCDFWAAEVHKYNGRYYLFGSCRAEGMNRATQIFVCDTPDGAYVPLAETARTPKDWGCLDGTLFVDDGKPYMVFCREYTQVYDGEMWALPLSDDLTHPVGDPIFLFRASDNPTVEDVGKGFITDGPFLFREDGKIKMLWSSMATVKYKKIYAVLEAQADSLLGPWTHFEGQYSFNGGHAMLFEDLDGNRRLAMHTPNRVDKERLEFFDY